jgi:hypothetical protein
MIPELLLRAPAADIKYAKKLQKISETILHNLTLLARFLAKPSFLRSLSKKLY